jgi:hypothetical protein
MHHKGTPIRYGQKHPVRNRQQGAEKISAAPHICYIQARNFLRNATVGMKRLKQAIRIADARKSGFFQPCGITASISAKVCASSKL